MTSTPAETTRNDTSEADEWISTHKESINERYRLGYHLMPPVGWMNDPNGLVYFKGLYHAFYQHHPYTSEWGPMHWGHATSTDMVHWVDRPVALAPGDGSDRDGCYSGSAVVAGDTLNLIYTGQIFNTGDIEPFNSDFSESQNLAISRDGTHFEKYAGNPVIPGPPSDNTQNFRDPKVWKHNDTWYVVIGSTSAEDDARALLYSSPDLHTWQLEGNLAQSDHKIGNMWECPDFFELDGMHILMMSPVGLEADGHRYRNVFQSGYIAGDFDYQTLQLTHGDFEELDRGHDFYAPQTFEAPDGRRICFGWMNMWLTPMPEQKDGWAGAFTLPRELKYVDGKVTMTPVKELESLRGRVLTDCERSVTNGDVIVSPDENRFELLFSVDNLRVHADNLGLAFDLGNGIKASFVYDSGQELLTFDRGGKDGERSWECGTLEHLDLHIYVDNSSIEIFVNNGLATFTSRIYPTAPARVTLLSSADSVKAGIQSYALN
jgi:beta-fructofuranosidase